MPSKIREDDFHITCLDTFSMAPVTTPQAPGPLEAFCHIPADQEDTTPPATTVLLPGVDVLDLYADSEKTEIWKNSETIECIAPRILTGWEFYNMLTTQPDGSSDLKLAGNVELLLGRPPGALHVPSLLFALVPEGVVYGDDGTPRSNYNSVKNSSSGQSLQTSSKAPPGPPGARGMRRTSTVAMAQERATSNLTSAGQSIMPRLVVLCPKYVYGDVHSLPDESSWGLFVGPRSRGLVLLNRAARIDLNQAMLFSTDAIFRKGQEFLSATARNFKAFGSEKRVAEMFSESSSSYDPLKVHCGLSNALVPDHLDIGRDGRDDFRRFLGCCPHQFFVSLSTENLRYLTAQEVQMHRTNPRAKLELPRPTTIPDYPRWVFGLGELQSQHRSALRKYRSNYVPHKPQAPGSSSGALMRMLGLYQPNSGEDALSKMVSALGACQEMSFAGSVPWEDDEGKPAGKAEPARKENVFDKEEPEGSSIHWRHSLDLVPGGDEESPRNSGRPASDEKAEVKDKEGRRLSQLSWDIENDGPKPASRKTVVERFKRWSVGFASALNIAPAPAGASDTNSDPGASAKSSPDRSSTGDAPMERRVSLLSEY